MSDERLRVISTDAPPDGASRKTGDFEPALTLMGEHDLCPGCGEPVALRQILDSIDGMNLSQKTIGVRRSGCVPTNRSSTPNARNAPRTYGPKPSAPTLVTTAERRPYRAAATATFVGPPPRKRWKERTSASGTPLSAG